MAQANPQATGRPARPLSPHLQVYRRPLSMMMSIFHRITGAALYFGTALLAWWLIAAAVGPSYFAFVNGLLGTPIGLLVLLGYTWALMHHMLGGIRHFVWDTGRGFDISSINAMSRMTLLGSLVLTAAIWATSGLITRPSVPPNRRTQRENPSALEVHRTSAERFPRSLCAREV